MEAILAGLANIGGMGLFAAALFLLHREALHTFREELKEERRMWTEAIQMERQERNLFLGQSREERRIQHQEGLERFDRIEELLERIEQDVQEVRKLCER